MSSHTQVARPLNAGSRWYLVLAALAVGMLSACQRPHVAPPAAPDWPSLGLPRTIELGRSRESSPLTLEVFGDGPDAIFIFGGLHGCEPTGAALAAQLADYLRQRPELWQDHTIGILARANPDGLAHHTRGNADGVDVNRNFPAQNWRVSDLRAASGGAAPASEPETQALMRAVELLRPTRILSIHSISRGRQCNNFDGPAEALAQAMAECNGYPAKSDIGYATPGSFGSWAGVDQGIPTITLELPREADEGTCWQENRAALLKFIDYAPGHPELGS